MTADPTFLPTAAERLLQSALGTTEGQCAAYYPGIEQQCGSEGVVFGTLSAGSKWEPFPLCADHAAEFGTCECGGKEPDLRFHREGICTDSLAELEAFEEPDADPVTDRDIEDYFVPS